MDATRKIVGIALVGLVLFLAGCELLLPPTVIPSAAQESCTSLGCPGGTIHLRVRGLRQTEGEGWTLWLIGTGVVPNAQMTDLRSHDMRDIPVGPYRAFVPPWSCRRCSYDEVVASPAECESVGFEIQGVEDTLSIDVSFDEARHCSIRIRR